MKKGTIALMSLGLGAGVMYLADPQAGKRRRARLRDASVHASHLLAAAAGSASRDIGNRTVGLAARARASVAEKPAPIGDVLVARVRARLGRLVSHPGAVEVKTRAAGVVVLSGPVFAAEVEQLVKGVRAVPGVTDVDNHLEVHAEAGDIPALQGPGPLKIRSAPVRWVRWTPTARVIAGVVGLVVMGLTSRTRPGPAQVRAA